MPTAPKTTSIQNVGADLHRSSRRANHSVSLSLALMTVTAVAVGGMNVGVGVSVVEAFPRMPTTSNGRLPLAVVVRNGQRKRPWHGTQDDIETSLWEGFDRGQSRTPSTISSKSTSTSATRLHLFFNKRGEDGNLTKQRKVTTEMLNELQSPGISFPKEVDLDANANVSLSLRYMTTDDLKALVPMCIREFGTFLNTQPNTNTNPNHQKAALLPRWVLDPKQIPDLWESFSFEMLIYWTLRLKLMQGGNSRDANSKVNLNSNSNQPSDPVMLVLCEQRKGVEPEINSNSNSNTEPFLNSLRNEPRVVGMVELSLQPPNADRNPPALPLPLWVKAALAKHTTLDGSLQGWVTNLLISDSRRGKGYSKILMAAVEGIAEHKWGCQSVYLHADADVRSGKVPQSLYEGLGYDLVIGSTKKIRGKGGKAVVEDTSAKFAWAGVSGKELERFTAIRMVDEVALLCYSKRL